MQFFSIRDMENLCGIKAHTLRIWEQRYGLQVAKRTESQRRVYDNEDLKHLLRISFLYHNGHKISSIAKLSPAAITDLVDQTNIGPGNFASSVQQLIEASVDLDKERFEKLITILVMRIGFEKSLLGVFFPFLQRVGLLWLTNHVLPAQEHFASHIIRKKIILATDGIEPAPSGPHSVLVFAPAGERHEIPLLTANYFFRKKGIRTCYFGTHVERDVIEYYLERQPATHLYAHIITKLKGETPGEYLGKLCARYPGIPVLVSGPGTKHLEQPPANLRVFATLDELLAFATELGRITSASHNS